MPRRKPRATSSSNAKAKAKAGAQARVNVNVKVGGTTPVKPRARAAKTTAATTPKPAKPRKPGHGLTERQIQRLSGTVRKVVREESATQRETTVYKAGREARAVAKWHTKNELKLARAKKKTQKGVEPTAKPKTTTPKPATPAQPAAPAFPEGAFSTIRTLPRHVGGRENRTIHDAAMSRAIEGRNRALGSNEIRFLNFESKKASVEGKLAAQRQKLERLKLKRGRAQAGAAYAKGRVWGLRQAWTKYWNSRITRLDKRIARTQARIDGLVKLSANVQARYEQQRAEYLRRYPNPVQAGRQTLAREREFMQRNLREQHTRMANDVTTLKRNRTVFLELKDRDPNVEQTLARIETWIPRIENAERAIQFEIIYRTMWNDLHRNEYTSALGWLSELDKLALMDKK